MRIWGYIGLVLLMALSASAILVDGSYTGPGNDYARSGQAVDSATDGFTQTGQFRELTKANGAVTQTYNTSSYLEEPVVCDVDSAIDGREIYKPAGNTLYVYDSNGQLQKSTVWSPKDAISCVDVDGDRYDDVVGVTLNLGTPVLSVYGMDGSSAGIKSENNLLGKGASPYSDMGCLSADENGADGVCAFLTSTRMLLYEYDTSAGNFGLLYEQPIERTQTDYVAVQPTWTAWDLLNNFWYLSYAQNSSFYLSNVTLDSSPSLDATSSISLGDFDGLGRVVYDSIVLGSTPRDAAQDVTLYGNSSVVLSKGTGSGGRWSVAQIRFHPGLTFLVEQNKSTAAWFDEDAFHTKLGQWDKNLDGYNDVMFVDIDPSFAYYTLNLFDGPTMRIGTIGISNNIAASGSGGSVAGANFEESGTPIITDLDDDGDLDYMQGLAFQIPAQNLMANPMPTIVDDGRRGTMSYWSPSVGGFAITSFSMNFTAAQEGVAGSVVFGDTQDDGFFDMVNGKNYYLNPFSVNLNSPPNFDVYETSPVALRCQTGGFCGVDNGTTVSYTVQFSDYENDPIYFAYDCDPLLAPAVSPLLVIEYGYNFTCDYPTKNLQINTTVYLSDDAVYRQNKTIRVTVSDNGLFCDNDGLLEPHLGETPENCLGDVQRPTTVAAQQQQVEDAAYSEDRAAIYEALGSDLEEEVFKLDVGEDGSIQESGGFSRIKEALGSLLLLTLTFGGFLVLIVVMLALIQRLYR